MIENQNGKRILLLGVYGMELVECGGTLLKKRKKRRSFSCLYVVLWRTDAEGFGKVC